MHQNTVKLQQKPFVPKVFFNENGILSARIFVESATVTFQKDTGKIDIEGIITDGVNDFLETASGKFIRFDEEQ